MNYKFPFIMDIESVRSAIDKSERTEFFIADRDWYQVANYSFATDKTFLDARGDHMETLLRECRGIIFNKEGKPIARRYHKFFNLNEREETKIENLDFSQHHVILEKLDGSMVTPIPTDEYQEIRWGTKMGITDGFADMVEDFVYFNPQYEEFALECIELNMTPIFEWCSRKSRIVVDHPEDRLVLTAIRGLYDGDYMPYENMVEFAEEYGVDVVRAYEGTVENIMELARTQVEGEGWVIRFDDGHMLKVKTDAYCAIHKAKSMITSEKAVLECIVNAGIDDLLPILYKEDADKLRSFNTAFWEEVEKTINMVSFDYSLSRSLYQSKKDYAIATQSSDPIRRSFIFKLWDSDGFWNVRAKVSELVINRIKSSLSSNRKLDENRALWGSLKWDYHNAEDVE